MKNIIAAFLFLVTWQEHELKPHYKNIPAKVDWSNCPEGSIFTYDAPLGSSVITNVCKVLEYHIVETVDKSIRLKTREDLIKFLGINTPMKYLFTPTKVEAPALIGTKAFNIQVKEIKPDGEVNK